MLKIGILSAYKKESIDEINRVAFDYVKAVEDTGIAMAFIIPCNTKNIKYYINDLDGFIIPGGDDISPELYGEKNNGSDETYIENDKFIFNFLDEIIKSEKLLIGICKGMQLINVYFGGKLDQDIKNKDLHNQYDKQYELVHNIIINDRTVLKDIFNKECISVNSIHHQVILKIGYGLDIMAKSDDGYIEAIVHKNHKNLYGFQWHPECLKDHNIIFKYIFSDYLRNYK